MHTFQGLLNLYAVISLIKESHFPTYSFPTPEYEILYHTSQWMKLAIHNQGLCMMFEYLWFPLTLKFKLTYMLLSSECFQEAHFPLFIFKFLAAPHSRSDLSSLTRGWTPTVPCSGGRVLKSLHHQGSLWNHILVVAENRDARLKWRWGGKSEGVTGE